jgi:hypothetical protein
MYIKWQYKWFGNKFLFFFNSPSELTFWITCVLHVLFTEACKLFPLLHEKKASALKKPDWMKEI